MNIETELEFPDLFSTSPLEHEAGEVPIIENEERIRENYQNMEVSDGRRFILKSEAFILKLAHAYNKILSLSNSRTRILAHQVESTHRIVNSLRQRFLIADEVGLGKTIEAGLVIKEMVYRHGYSRILIVCPASLMFQWQNEMESKFNEKFIIMDRRVLSKAAKSTGGSGNPWNVYNKVICSLDFIKNKKFIEEIGRCSWDAVIFDEAHRLRRDVNTSTLAYTMAETIAGKTKSLLLLSATPFRGKLEELFFLIGLIDRNILGPFQSFYNEYCLEGADLSGLKRKLDQVVIRRTKNEVGGFTKRFARTIRFELYPDERTLYDETTRYVAEEFNRALQSENRAVGFIMTVFQKLLDSSSYALFVALKKRSERLKGLLDRAETAMEQFVTYTDNVLEGEDFSDMDELPAEDGLTVKKTVSELKAEITTLERLVFLASQIDVNKKGEKLVRLIRDLKRKGHKKFLIFTQFRTTQDYLSGILSDFSVVVFNGSMNRDQKEEAILRFKESVEIIIATEAGGEGRNMQFCDVLINYDLPWSPLKIEQRIGRIHRFGQPNDVHIYNFSTRGTVAERVLEVLTDKLRIFEESIGTPDIMLGQIEDEVNLNTLFMELATGRKRKRDVEEELAGRIENARQSFEKLTELTVAGKMDFNYDEYYKVTLKERSFTNRRIERFINEFMAVETPLQKMISLKSGRNGLYKVTRCGDDVQHRLGTFDSERALEDESLEFLAFGHDVVDGIIDHCCSDSFSGETGAVFIRGGKRYSGMVFSFLVKFTSLSVTHEYFPVIVEAGDTLDSYDLKSIEESFADQDFAHDIRRSEYTNVISGIASEYDRYYATALNRLLEKINSRVDDLNENLEIQIDPEVEKIRESYRRQIKELEERLDLQEGQMKWYGKDMKSAVTRTKNRIMKARREMESLVTEYSGYYGVRYNVKLTGAAVIISVE